MIIPTTHRIVVKQRKISEVNEDHKRAEKMGLYIPDTDDKKRAQSGVDQGIVLAIGPTAYQDYNTVCPINIGDNIAFARYSGKVIKDPDDDEEYVVLNDEDVVAILVKTIKES